MSSCAAIVQPNAPTTLKRSGSMDAAHSGTLRCGQALSGTLCFSIGTTVFKRHDDVTPKVWTNPNTRGFRFEVDGGTENSDHKKELVEEGAIRREGQGKSIRYTRLH